MPHWTIPWDKATKKSLGDLVTPSNGPFLPILVFQYFLVPGTWLCKWARASESVVSRLLALYKAVLVALPGSQWVTHVLDPTDDQHIAYGEVCFLPLPPCLFTLVFSFPPCAVYSCTLHLWKKIYLQFFLSNTAGKDLPERYMCIGETERVWQPVKCRRCNSIF